MWMNLSHPNILQLIGIGIDSQSGPYSMISEMMVNGNIKEYIRRNPANRHCLVRCHFTPQFAFTYLSI
jgi:hypothetical protein